MPKEKGKMFYGWWVVVGLFFSTFCGAWGRFILSVCGPAISRDTGWSTSDIMLSLTIALFVYSIAVLIVGRLVDKIGGRRVITIGSICLMVGFALLSMSNELWQIYIVHGVLLAIAVSMTHTVPVQGLGRKWFIKRSGLVGGLLIGAFSISTAILSPVLTQSAATIGWRTTSLIAMAFGAVVLLFALFVIRNTPESMGLRPYGAEEETSDKDAPIEEVNIPPNKAIRTVPFWGLCLAFGLIGIPIQGLLTNLIFWGEATGMEPGSAGLVLTAYCLPAIFAKLIWGTLGDKYGKRKMQIIGQVLCIIVMLASWLWVESTLSLFILGVAFGLVYGNIALLIPYMGDIFGRKSIGTLTGYVTAAHGLFGAIGPFLWGKIFDVTGTYNLACLISAVVYFLVLICLILARPLSKEAVSALSTNNS